MLKHETPNPATRSVEILTFYDTSNTKMVEKSNGFKLCDVDASNTVEPDYINSEKMTEFKIKNPHKINYIDAKIGYKGPFEFDIKL